MKRNSRPRQSQPNAAARPAPDSSTAAREQRAAGVPSADQTPPPIEPTHPVLQAVAAHLRQHDFSYAVTSGGDGLLFTMAEDGRSWSSAVHVIEDKQMLRIVARLPLFVPVAGRREATALLARLNFGNLVGSWQMDPADGETIYVTTHIFADGFPLEDTIKTLMMITAMSLAREGPRILRLIQRPARLPKTSPDPSRN